jgi:hypothetical protein
MVAYQNRLLVGLRRWAVAQPSYYRRAHAGLTEAPLTSLPPCPSTT